MEEKAHSNQATAYTVQPIPRTKSAYPTSLGVMLCAQHWYNIPGMKGDGVKVNRNMNSSDLVLCVQNFVQQVQKFANRV